MRYSLCVVGLLVSLSTLAQQSKHNFAFESILGNQIAWSCEGAGEPKIVLIAGGGLDAHSSFSRIYHSYQGPGQICMYDRAGIGQSTFANPRTRSLSELSDELHELSIKMNWAKSVLVAHSFGGFVARAYASAHSEDVIGILFLDAAQEDWLPSLKAKLSPSDWSIMEKIVAWSEATFHENYFEAQEAVRNATISKSMPITVVSRGVPHTQIRLEKMSYEGVGLYNDEHDAMQPKLVALSSNAVHRIATVSSHMIDDFDPWLVIDEIERLVVRATQ